MWPTFAAITLLDGLLLHRLSPVREGIDLIPAILIATFGNLILVGAIGPWLARRIWKRRPAADRVGTALLVASVFGLLVVGLANRPVIVVETNQRERAAKLLEDYVESHGDAELRRNLEASDTRRYADGYYRSCIPHDDRRRATCFLIDVRDDRAEFTRDRSEIPNKPQP
jgi:hypothetical protein